MNVYMMGYGVTVIGQVSTPEGNGILIDNADYTGEVGQDYEGEASYASTVLFFKDEAGVDNLISRLEEVKVRLKGLK